jgi:hypothetical protein
MGGRKAVGDGDASLLEKGVGTEEPESFLGLMTPSLMAGAPRFPGGKGLIESKADIGEITAVLDSIEMTANHKGRKTFKMTNAGISGSLLEGELVALVQNDRIHSNTRFAH